MLERKTGEVALTIASGAALSEAFAMSYFSGGNTHMPAAWTAANIGFQISDDAGGTFRPLKDSLGQFVEMVVAVDTAVSMPSALFACRWVKLWSQDGAGANVNQAADRALVVELKS